MSSGIINENYSIEIRAKLNEDKIKLWTLPYYDASLGTNTEEIESLAEIYTVMTKIPKPECIAALHAFQNNAIQILSIRKEFSLTGIATLKLKIPEQGGTKLLTIKQKLDMEGNELQENISGEIGIAAHRVKMFSDGKVINNRELLNSQGINFSRDIVLVILPEVPASENVLIEIRLKLNEDKIKLWSLPYYDATLGPNCKEIKSLAEIYTVTTKIRKRECIDALHEFQNNAIEKLRARKEFLSTGVATLKLRIPEQKGGTKLLTIKQKLDVGGNELQENVSVELGVAAHRLKMLSEGKVIQEREPLNSQGINFNRHIVILILPDVPTYDAVSENKIFEKLLRMREMAELLVNNENNCLEMEIQDQNAIYISPNVKKQLVFVLALHEAGRIEMNKENFKEALICFTEADEEFDQFEEELDLDDNYTILNMDMAWCNLCLNKLDPKSQQRLIKCEQNFKKNYGDDFARFVVNKDSGGNDKALILRLHLLQAIMLFRQNQYFEAANKLLKAETELKSLKINKVPTKKQEEDSEETILEKVLAKINTSTIMNTSAHKKTKIGNMNNSIDLLQHNPFEFLKSITPSHIQELINLAISKSLYNVDDVIDYVVKNEKEGTYGPLIENLINNPEMKKMADAFVCSMDLGGPSTPGKMTTEEIEPEYVNQQFSEGFQKNQGGNYLDLSLIREEGFLNEYKNYLNALPFNEIERHLIYDDSLD